MVMGGPAAMKCMRYIHTPNALATSLCARNSIDQPPAASICCSHALILRHLATGPVRLTHAFAHRNPTNCT